MRLHILLLILFFSGLTVAQTPAMPVVSLKIADHSLTVEVANTQQLRAQGLMNRTSLAKNSGMLFVFPEVDYYSMWMLNTLIPLSVAFLDEQGIILNVADMVPNTLTAHGSAGVAKYALEMNQGWFAARGIMAGEKVLGLEKIPEAN